MDLNIFGAPNYGNIIECRANLYKVRLYNSSLGRMPKVMVDVDDETDRDISLLKIELRHEGKSLTKPEIVRAILKELDREEIEKTVRSQLGGENE